MNYIVLRFFIVLFWTYLLCRVRKSAKLCSPTFALLPYIWDKVFKNGPSKICKRQPLKNLKGYGLPKEDLTPSKVVFNKFCCSIFEYLVPFSHRVLLRLVLWVTNKSSLDQPDIGISSSQF